MVTREIARIRFASPMVALIQPVRTKARQTATTVIGILSAGGGRRMASIGRTAPVRNETADENAACQGLVNA